MVRAGLVVLGICLKAPVYGLRVAWLSAAAGAGVSARESGSEWFQR